MLFQPQSALSRIIARRYRPRFACGLAHRSRGRAKIRRFFLRALHASEAGNRPGALRCLRATPGSLPRLPRGQFRMPARDKGEWRYGGEGKGASGRGGLVKTRDQSPPEASTVLIKVTQLSSELVRVSHFTAAKRMCMHYRIVVMRAKN